MTAIPGRLFGITLLAALVSTAQAGAEKDVAVILKSQGSVSVMRESDGREIAVTKGTRLNSGNLLRTGEESLAALVFTDDKSLLKIRSNSKVVIKGTRENNSILKTIAMEFGQLWAKVTKSNNTFQIQTPSGVAAVKGTVFYCLTDRSGKTLVICMEGLMEIFSDWGKTLVQPGQTGVLEQGQEPFSRPSDPAEIPTWGATDDDGGALKIEFQNGLGEKRNLNIKFE